MADEKSDLQKHLEQQLSSSLTGGKIDAAKLRKQNPPLAQVLDEFVSSKTTRDDPTTFAKDLARTIDARDPNSSLAVALATLEEHLKAQM